MLLFGIFYPKHKDQSTDVTRLVGAAIALIVCIGLGCFLHLGRVLGYLWVVGAIYIYIYVYSHPTYIYIYTCIHMRTYVITCMHAYIHKLSSIPNYLPTYIHTYIIYRRIHARSYVYTYVCTCIHASIYIYICYPPPKIYQISTWGTHQAAL